MTKPKERRKGDKTIKALYDWQVNHEKDDNERFKKMDDFINRMEPVINTFERNEITRMTIKKDTGTIVFYAKSIGIIGGALWGLYWAYKKLTL